MILMTLVWDKVSIFSLIERLTDCLNDLQTLFSTLNFDS